MPEEKISFKDAVVDVHAGVFGPTTIDVVCRNLTLKDLSPSQFAELVYPAIDAAAKMAAGGDVPAPTPAPDPAQLQ